MPTDSFKFFFLGGRLPLFCNMGDSRAIWPLFNTYLTGREYRHVFVRKGGSKVIWQLFYSYWVGDWHSFVIWVEQLYLTAFFTLIELRLLQICNKSVLNICLVSYGGDAIAMKQLF